VVLRVIGRQGAAVLVRVVGIILASLAVDVSSRPICPIFEV
jgi:small neutral amino acid transporter SnatA (MarC family)